MRDDFSAGTKDLLARRVGFKCSNPACRQPTAGPQVDTSGTVNLGVAAHITAASPDGRRYNADLTSVERSAAANGIWLCQTDGKLIDNDEIKFTVQLLNQWKALAEATASKELEQRLEKFPEHSTVLLRMERLMPGLLAEMRQDLAAHPLKREFILMKRGWVYNGDGPLCYFFDDHPDLKDKVRLLKNAGLVFETTYNNVERFDISEELADYLGAP